MPNPALILREYDGSLLRPFRYVPIRYTQTAKNFQTIIINRVMLDWEGKIRAGCSILYSIVITLEQNWQINQQKI